jgi:hypothetical protein
VSLLFNFSLEYAIRKVQENYEWLELSGTHQLPVYTVDVKFMDEIINTVKKKTDTVLDTDKKFGQGRSVHVNHIIPANTLKTKNKVLWYSMRWNTAEPVR